MKWYGECFVNSCLDNLSGLRMGCNRWDRALGRSLKHLVEIVNEFEKRDIGLLSLNDPVDTTTAQGRLNFNIFASLTEFEKDLIKERTNAGLTAARARGRIGGRPRGLSK